MPELPEVETVRRSLNGHVTGGVIVAVELLREDIVSPASLALARRLTGQTIQSLERRGKRLIFTLASRQQFIIHLGMTGRLTLHCDDEECRKHTHLKLTIRSAQGEQRQVRFCDPRRFRGLHWLAAGEAADAGLGPEPLGIRTAELARQLEKSHRPIKNALLDQRLLAGLGNIYADEALFAAGIHPLRFCDKLSPAEVETLRKSIQATLRSAIRHRGSTVRDYVDAAGGKGSFQDLHNVYGRSGQPCRKCGAVIQRRVLAGRSACFCPKCQPQ